MYMYGRRAGVSAEHGEGDGHINAEQEERRQYHPQKQGRYSRQVTHYTHRCMYVIRMFVYMCQRERERERVCMEVRSVREEAAV